MRNAFARIRVCLAAACLLTVGLRANIAPLLTDWRTFADNGNRPDIVTREAKRYEPLISSLPIQGTVGYFQPDDWPTADAVRRFYLAEYALTPRIVVFGTAPQFVIVVPEVSVESVEKPGLASRDPRLTDYALYEKFDNGLRVFRRLK
jgi:hypothetical protein